MFGRLGVFKGIFDLGYFRLMMALLGCNPITSRERSVVAFSCYFFMFLKEKLSVGVLHNLNTHTGVPLPSDPAVE